MPAPAPGTRVSSLTLRVRLGFQAQPYQITDEYSPALLKAVLDRAGDTTSLEILEATDHVPWVALQQVFVRGGDGETVSSSETEARYRKFCAETNRTPSQDGFLVFAIQEITGLQVGSF